MWLHVRVEHSTYICTDNGYCRQGRMFKINFFCQHFRGYSYMNEISVYINVRLKCCLLIFFLIYLIWGKRKKKHVQAPLCQIECSNGNCKMSEFFHQCIKMCITFYTLYMFVQKDKKFRNLLIQKHIGYWNSVSVHICLLSELFFLFFGWII